MDYKGFFEYFKDTYLGEADFLSFSLIPTLMLELKKNGYTQDIFSGSFLDDFRSFFLANAKAGVSLRFLEYVGKYRSLLPEAEVVSKPAPVVQETVKPVSKSKTFSDDYIPTEEEEGDGLYIPEEERIYLKPEDCADVEYDWDLIERLGAVGFKK